MQILFNGISGYKTLQKLVVFLYSNKEISGKEIKKTVSFTKYLWLHQKNKIPGNELNQGDEGPIHWKVH